MENSYCSLCGQENEPSAVHCAKCGVDLSPGASHRPLAPLRWGIISVVLVASVLVMIATHLLEALEGFAFQWQTPSTITEATKSLVALDSLSELWLPAGIWFVSGIVLAILARRKVLREGLVIGLGLCVAQLFLWIYAVDFRVGLLFSADLQIFRAGMQISLPMLIFLLLGVASILIGSLAGAALGGALVERVTGRVACIYCDKPLRTQPLPLACPHCAAPVPQPKIQWGWAWVGVLVTTVLFCATLQFLGPVLGFYYHCGNTEQSEQCDKARLAFGEGRALKESNPWVRITSDGGEGEKGFFVMYQTWKYMLYMAVCFFVMPFLLALLLKKGAMATAGISIPFSWLTCLFCALLLFDLGTAENTFLYSLRLHIFAFFAWGLAGSAGAFFGYKFGYSPAKEMMAV